MTDLKINTYPKHIGDWRSGTARMSLAEEGAYTRLVDQYYLDQGDGWTTDECLRICRAVTRDEQKAVKSVLTGKFEKTDLGYRHTGIDARIVDIEVASAKNQKRSKTAADARWSPHRAQNTCLEDATSNASSIDQAMLEECYPKAKSQKPVKIAADASASASVVGIPATETRDWPPPAETAQALAKSAGLASAQWQLLTASELLKWRANGLSYELDVLPTVTAVAGRGGSPPRSWSYFTSSITQAHANRLQSLTIPEAQHERRSPSHNQQSAGRPTDYIRDAVERDQQRRGAELDRESFFGT